MKANIYEIKCPISNLNALHQQLIGLDANFIGTDHQIDTYFKVPTGRLKLRQGNIENTLIFYNRIETKSIKHSKVELQKLGSDTAGIKNILTAIHGILKIVDKQRRIYFIDNVKFHLDEVLGLGTFMEIEAIDETDQFSPDQLREQCANYIDLFSLDRTTFLDKSYSDLVMENKG